MTDRTHPDSGRIITSSDVIADLQDRIAELEAQIEALSGVQALSAAPASPWSRALEIRMAQGWKLRGDRIPVLYTDTINGECVGRDDLWLCTTEALAASPTPPAEQPVGRDEDEALDLLAILFDAWEDGTPCYEEPESSDGYLGHAFRLDGNVFHRCADLLNRRRSKTDTPTAEQLSANKAAPGGQNTVPAEWLEQAYREGWAACRDAETIWEEAEDWAFGNSTANSRMIDAQQAAPTPPAEQAAPKAAPVTQQAGYAEVIECGNSYAKVKLKGEAFGSTKVGDIFYTAPQQEAQGPVAYVHVPHSTVEGKVRPVVSFEKYQQDYADGIYSTRIPLYTAPQPAPAPLSDDTERLEWLLWKLPGDALRYVVGELADTSSGSEFRAAIDAALAAQGGKV